MPEIKTTQRAELYGQCVEGEQYLFIQLFLYQHILILNLTPELKGKQICMKIFTLASKRGQGSTSSAPDLHENVNNLLRKIGACPSTLHDLTHSVL